jgi:hypothetical protein
MNATIATSAIIKLTNPSKKQIIFAWIAMGK